MADGVEHGLANAVLVEGRDVVFEQPFAKWAATPDIPLNPGLVAIIGARGAGKTALGAT